MLLLADTVARKLSRIKMEASWVRRGTSQALKVHISCSPKIQPHAPTAESVSAACQANVVTSKGECLQGFSSTCSPSWRDIVLLCTFPKELIFRLETPLACMMNKCVSRSRLRLRTGAAWTATRHSARFWAMGCRISVERIDCPGARNPIVLLRSTRWFVQRRGFFQQGTPGLLWGLNQWPASNYLPPRTLNDFSEFTVHGLTQVFLFGRKKHHWPFQDPSTAPWLWILFLTARFGVAVRCQQLWLSAGSLRDGKPGARSRGIPRSRQKKTRRCQGEAPPPKRFA